MVSLQCKFKNLIFNNPISNASGVFCKERSELLEMLHSFSGTFITKSCTLNARSGNEKPSYWENNRISINSMGLPNYGYRYYTDFIKDLEKEELNKHCFLSIANINNKETKEILRYINDKSYIKYPEINVSCPNIKGKEQLGYNYMELENFLIDIEDIYDKPFGLKLPPFFDPVQFERIAQIVKYFDNIEYLTCVNSIGNALEININNECGVIKPKDGLGGLGGCDILPVALSNVYQFKKLLPDLDIIGCGGIRSGEDVFKHLLVGASFVQIGTTLHRESFSCINRILKELEDIMLKKGYTTIDDFRGKYNEHMSI
jgi:dihydroorotate dehydrogenase (fumarate)